MIRSSIAKAYYLTSRIFDRTVTTIKDYFRFYKEKIEPQPTYSQFGEDLIVEKLIGKVDYFIDIGAFDGISSSNTFFFALQGSKGLCFEPLGANFAKLRRLYCTIPRVKCYKYGISNRTGYVNLAVEGVLSFIPETEDVIHSGNLKRFMSRERKMQKALVKSFEDALKNKNVPEYVDLLSIDVEGHELNVLNSIDFDHWNFKVIIVETHALNDDGTVGWIHRDISDMEQRLASCGYWAIIRTELNSIYTKNKIKIAPTLQIDSELDLEMANTYRVKS